MRARCDTISLMDTDYRFLRNDDAPLLLDFMKKASSETDNLAFSLPDIEKLDAADERIFITEVRKSPSIYAAAFSSGAIIGICEIRVSRRLRTKHRGELAIAVLREYWGMGIGQHLFEFAEAEAKDRGVASINLSVRNDNERAIAFFKRNGFSDVGADPMLMYIDGEYIDGERFALKLQ